MWSSNAINTGIGTFSGQTRLAYFQYLGSLYVIINHGGTFKAFKFNTSNNTWESYTPFQTFGSSVSGLYPTVFIYNNQLYLLIGDVSAIYGWSFDGTKWVSNTVIKTGISGAGLYTSPATFFINTDLYLILGNSDGVFFGFKWNGSTTWTTDTSIISGLTDIGSYARPNVFYKDADLYLISGESQSFKGYKRGATTWLVDTDIVSGLVNNVSNHPAAFYKDADLYLLAGSIGGNIYGYKYTPPPPPAKLASVNFVVENNYQTKLLVTLNQATIAGETIKAYYSQSDATLTNPENEIILSTDDNIHFYKIFAAQDVTPFYLKAEQYFNGSLITSITNSGTLYLAAQVETTYINITDPNNYKILTGELEHRFNHGLIFKDGFLFGSARGGSTEGDNINGHSISKIEAANYSNILQKRIYLNKNASTSILFNFDQIIYCSGFLWVNNLTYIVRINPSDLDYIVFSGAPMASNGQPMVTDGTFIYLSGDDQAHKLDVTKLIGTFSSYGYTGDAAVLLPNNTILASCNIINTISPWRAYVHSSTVDNQYLFLAATVSPSTTTGFDSSNNTYIFHFQKILKSTMQTLGDVTIPKCTDDMVQDAKYVYLVTEYPSAATGLYGASWNVLAINKSTLEIKYLKALHKDYLAADPITRQSYGIFYFNNKLSVQLWQSRATIVLNTANVDEWGENFPIGGATEKILKFKLNNVDFNYPCNELVLDSSGMVHVNTWQVDTMLFKFNLSQLTPAVNTPTIQTSLIGSNSNSATFGGFVISEGNSPVTSGGFKWGTAPEALTNDLPANPFSYDFQELLSGLSAGVYYFKAYGTNTEGTFYGNVVMFSTYNAVELSYNNTIALLELLNAHYGCSIRCVQDAPGVPTGTTGTVTDQDGNTYDTVVINEKRWMVQNLKTKKYRNGDAIPEVSGATAWQELSSGGYCNVI